MELKHASGKHPNAVVLGALKTVRQYRFDPYVLDLAKRELRRHGVVQVLQARVFECLCCLIDNRERAVSRDELTQAVFSRTDVSDAQLAQIVLRSRRAIGDDGHEQRAIQTVPRFGFRWSTEVLIVAEDVDPLPGANDDEATAPPPLFPPWPRVALATALSRHSRGGGLAASLMVMAITLAALMAWAVPERTASPAISEVPATGSGSGILVLPTRVSGSEDTAWARLGLMDLVVDRMRRAGLPALSSDATLAVLHQNQAIERDPQRLRALVRARWLVVGDVARVGELWKVQLSASDSIGVVQKGHASGRDLVDAARIASDRLLAALGGKVPRGEEADPRLSERLQRARSAMLANELDTARKILMEAPELQRSQPQLRYHLAQIDFRAGQFTRGLRTLDELLEASATGNDRLFGAKLNISRGAMLIRLDRYGESERSYDAAVQALAGTSFAAELGQALTGRAVSRSSQGDFDRALADLGQARMQLTRVGDPLGVARVDANLGNLEMDRDRPALAVDYYRKAASDMQALGAMNELAAIRGMLVSAHLEMLDIGQALEESRRLWLLLERIRDPGQRANVILTRAEALIASGRVGDASHLLRMPEIEHVVPGEFRRPEFLRMEIARQRSDPQTVLRVADAALRDWPAGHNAPLRGWVLLRRNQAAHQLDIAPLQADPIPEDKVSGRLAKAMAGRGRGDAADAERHYRSALALAEARGVPAEVAEVVEAYAGWLLDIDRAVAAGTLIGRVAPWAEQDFELSLLQVRLFQQMGQREQWNDALRHARELAGERRIPRGLGIFAAKPQRQVSARQ